MEKGDSTINTARDDDPSALRADFSFHDEPLPPSALDSSSELAQAQSLILTHAYSLRAGAAIAGG